MAGSLNPFNGINVGSMPKPNCFNMDADQDIDCLFGNQDGTFKYFRNTGTVTASVFGELTSTANPFNGIDMGTRAAPFCFNIVGGNTDMDFECIVGNGDGKVYTFKNSNGTSIAPVYVQTNDADNLFNGVDVGSNAAPTCFDVDGELNFHHHPSCSNVPHAPYNYIYDPNPPR